MKLFTAVAAAAAIALVGCSQEEADTLEKAFENEIDSAQVSMRFDVDVADGRDGLLTLRGPYQRNGDDRLVSFDWTVRGEMDGQRPFEVRAISTGDRVFVAYDGTTYEAGPDAIKELNAQSAGEQADLEDIERLPGVDLKSWFPESETEEDGEVAGEETTHISGRLDVSAALNDIAQMLRHPAVRKQLGASKNDRLSEREIRMLDRLVSDPRFDVHVGKSDGKLRRLAGSLRFRDPRKKAGGGTLSFAVEYAKVDEPVRIAAPEGKARPIEDLLQRLGAKGR